MTLGDMIAALDDEAKGASALEALGDIVLLAEVRAMAEAFGESEGGYVATSARRFAALAGDEAWLSLIGVMEQAPMPGQIALQRMLRWALDVDAKEIAQTRSGAGTGCSCGKHGCA